MRFRRFEVLVAAILLVSPAFAAFAADGSEAMTRVRGTVLDEAERYPDGTTRFHLLEEGVAPSTELAEVSVAGTVRERPLLEFGQLMGPAQPWRTIQGKMSLDNGAMVAAGPQDIVAFGGLSADAIRVSFTADTALQCGAIGHVVDDDNYILAFYAPAQRVIGFHSVVGGNFGSWINSIATPTISAGKLTFVADFWPDEVHVTVRDAVGTEFETSMKVDKPGAGRNVGLYFDTGSVEGTQRFQDLKISSIERGVPVNAIEVVLPPEHRGENLQLHPGNVAEFTGVEKEAGANGLRRFIVHLDGAVIEGARVHDADTIFPTSVPRKDWVHFDAQGYDVPACGVVYRLEDTVTNGLALGGIETGCIDLETSGLLGYCTIFNTHVPRRGPVNLPILGLNVDGQSWVLCDPQPKQGWGGAQVPVEPVLDELSLDGVKTANQIHYWGHYPVADLEFDTSAPVSVGLRSWSPFLPGDTIGSNVPAIMFEAQLRNPTDFRQKGTLAFSFPGPTNKEANSDTFERVEVSGPVTGFEVKGELANYAMGVIGRRDVTVGGELGADGDAWAAIDKTLPPVDDTSAGGSISVPFDLAAGKSEVVRFVVTWSAPTWKGGGYNWNPRPHVFTHMYDKYYPDASETLKTIAKDHEKILKRIVAWQSVVYTEDSLPVWLRDSLINILYLITETAHWAQKADPLPEWVQDEDGLFGMNECPRGCPQVECIPCSFYGNQPLVYFFPELALSTLRGYKGYQYPDGAPPWIFGHNGPEMAQPTRGYQFASNGISLAAMVDRFLLCHETPDKQYAKEFYPMMKLCMEWTVGLRTTPSYTEGMRVIAMPDPDSDEVMLPPTEWFEAREPGWAGMTAHIGGLHLAQVRITEKMAREVGDTEFAEQCAEWIRLGAQAMEEHLWTGSYYLNYLDPATDRKSDFIFGYQLDGEWITDHHGLPSALPEDRVYTVLDTIKHANIALTKYGAVNYANPDGTVIPPAKPGTWDYGRFSYFPPEALMLSMTYMYQGQKDFGTELARRVWHNLICQQGYTWDMPNIMRGDVDTGERTFGNDYYQDMMLWSMPAAMAGEDFGSVTRPGGLVARMIEAAAK